MDINVYITNFTLIKPNLIETTVLKFRDKKINNNCKEQKQIF